MRAILNRVVQYMKYLVSIHRPYGFDYSVDADAMHKDIDLVNDEMVAAGVRIFVCGLASTSLAKSVHRQANGDLDVTDGPFLESSEYVDGFWVLECATIDEALDWGRKAASACRGSVEVRPLAG